MTNEFTQLGLHPQLVQAVTDLGYTTPTPSQSEVISLMLAGHDVIGQAQTGTGKTAAFALPRFPHLPRAQRCIQVLERARSRELASHVAQETYEAGPCQRVQKVFVRVFAR